MPEQVYASFATEDLREQSNLFDNVDARVQAFQFTKTPPPNYTFEKDADPIFAIITFLIDGDAPVPERTVTQSYSLGATSGREFSISADGYGLIPISTEMSSRKGTKFTTLTESFQKVGIASTLLKSGDFSKLIGLYGHWMRVADKPRNFQDDQLSSRRGKTSKFPPSTLCLTKIIAMPGEKGAAVPATASAAKATKANGKDAPAMNAAAVDAQAAFTETGDLDSDTMECLLAALRASKNTDSDGRKVLQRGQLTLAMGRVTGTTNPNRGVYAKRAFDEAFLTNLDGLGIVVYGQAIKGQPIALPAGN